MTAASASVPPDSRILERVRALLALARSSNEHEAHAAATQASRLMLKHQIHEAELHAGAGADPEEPVGFHAPLFASRRKVTWKSALANTLARAHGCRTVNWTDTDPRGHRVDIRIFGRATDVENVRYLFAWLVLTAERLAKAEVKAHPDYPPRKFRNDWLRGFVRGVRLHLEALRKDVRSETSASALVLVDAREQVVESAFGALAGIVDERARTAKVFAAAYRGGTQAGTSIHLGASLGTDRGPRLLPARAGSAKP